MKRARSVPIFGVDGGYTRASAQSLSRSSLELSKFGVNLALEPSMITFQSVLPLTVPFTNIYPVHGIRIGRTELKTEGVYGRCISTTAGRVQQCTPIT